MKWYELTLPRYFGAKTSHHQIKAAGSAMRSDENFLDTSPAFDASGTVVLMESEGGQRRNNYKQGDVGPPGNDTEDGANRIATKI